MDWMYTTGALLRDMQTNRLRRILSILGVVIGTSAVIASLAVLEGGREQLSLHLERLGVNMVFLEDRLRPETVITHEYRRDQVTLSQEAAPDSTTAKGRILVKRRMAEASESSGDSENVPVPIHGVLRMRDVSALRARFPGANMIEPVMTHWSDVAQAGGSPFGARIEGGTPAGAVVRDLQITEGRHLIETDIDHSEKVCVLGAEAADKLFGQSAAVGRTVSMLGSRWRVVGVLAQKGTMMRFDYDRLIIVPITSLQERTGVDMVNALLIQARDGEAASRIRTELKAEVLARLHGRDPEEIRIFCQDDLVAQYGRTMSTFRILTISIAAFSLLVSGIGIMNIMLVSVRERTREIGVWKAVGATDADVLSFFLAESVLTCVLGGTIGIFLGVLLASEASGFVANSVSEMSTWTPVFHPVFFGLSLGTTILVGLLSGIFPAIVAAHLEPTEALRYG